MNTPKDDKKPADKPAETTTEKPATEQSTDAGIEAMIAALPDPSARKRKPVEPPAAKAEDDKPKEKADDGKPDDKAEGDDKKADTKKVAKKTPAVPESVKRVEAAAEKLEKLAEQKRRTEEEEEAPKKPVKKTGDSLVDPDEPELSEREKRRLEVFEHMAKENEAEYGSFPAQFKQGLKKWGKYRAKWEKEHPDEEFNPKDEAHDDIYASIFPQPDEEDYMDAAATVRARKLIEQDANRREEVQRRDKVKGDIETKSKAVITDGSKALMEELLGVDAKDLAALDEEEPALAAVLEPVIEKYSALAEAAVALLTPGSPIKADARNPVHADLLNRMDRMDRAIAALPTEQKLWETDEGILKFATKDEWLEMTPKQRAHHWTLWNQPQHVTGLLISEDFVEKAKARVGKIRDVQLQKPASTQAGKAADTTTTTKPALTQDNPPPSMAGASKRSPTDGNAAAQADRLSVMEWR